MYELGPHVRQEQQNHDLLSETKVLCGVGSQSTKSRTKGISTFVGVLRCRAERLADKQVFCLLVDGETEGDRLSYAELDLRARAIGAALQSCAKMGQRAILLYPSGLEFVSAFYGCMYAGVTAVPVYPPNFSRPQRTLPRFLSILSDAQPSLVLTTSLIKSLAEKLYAEQPELRAMCWLATDLISIEQSQDWVEPTIAEETLAFLQYTSGSTSQPKGVMVTHKNLICNAEIIKRAFNDSEESSCVSWLPPYHDMGLVGHILQPVYVGGSSFLMSPVDFLQRPFRWLQAISRHQVTTSGGPNFAYELCLRRITDEQRSTLDLTSWRLAFSGAEPVRAETLDRFAKVFASCGFRREALYPCYGLAEATLMVSGAVAGQPALVEYADPKALEKGQVVFTDENTNTARALVSCGRSPLEQQIVIVDVDSLTECEPQRVGEIWVKGGSVAQGYWQKAEESERTFQARPLNTDKGPFLRTGDLGFMKDGELFVTGRLKDLIVIDGRNHYPQDIELTVDSSHTALSYGCSAAFSVDIDGKERLVVLAEVRRFNRQDQATGSDGTPRQSDLSGREVPSESVYQVREIGLRQSLDMKEVSGAIIQAVAENHDLHTHAVLLLKAGSIPKTSSGKIQRHACRAGFLANTLDVVFPFKNSGLLGNSE